MYDVCELFQVESAEAQRPFYHAPVALLLFVSFPIGKMIKANDIVQSYSVTHIQADVQGEVDL